MVSSCYNEKLGLVTRVGETYLIGFIATEQIAARFPLFTTLMPFLYVTERIRDSGLFFDES